MDKSYGYVRTIPEDTAVTVDVEVVVSSKTSTVVRPAVEFALGDNVDVSMTLPELLEAADEGVVTSL